MLGTGIQEDPYIPENITEFITALNQTGAYVECKENDEFNCSELASNTTFVVRCKYFDGHNAKLLNIESSVYNLFIFYNQTEFNNLVIKDFSFNGTNFFNLYNQYVYNRTFNNIILIGEMLSGRVIYAFSSVILDYCLYFDSHSVNIFNKCGFYIDYSENAYFMSGAAWFVRSYLHFEGNVLSNANGFYGQLFCIHTLIDGKSPTADKSFTSSSVTTNAQNVFNFEADTFDTLIYRKTISNNSVLYFPTNTMIKLYFYNSDKAPKGFSATNNVFSPSNLPSYINGVTIDSWRLYSDMGGDIDV